MDNQKHDDEQSQTVTQTPDRSRRQIIRGLAAAPVILTLTSGTANAAVSLQCYEASKFRPDLPPGLDADGCTTTQPIRQVNTVPEYSSLDSALYDNGDGTAVFQDQGSEYCPLYVDSGGSISSGPGLSGDPTTASCLNSFT